MDVPKNEGEIMSGLTVRAAGAAAARLMVIETAWVAGGLLAGKITHRLYMEFIGQGGMNAALERMVPSGRMKDVCAPTEEALRTGISIGLASGVLEGAACIVGGLSAIWVAHQVARRCFDFSLFPA
jgi:hypothetical protein